MAFQGQYDLLLKMSKERESEKVLDLYPILQVRLMCFHLLQQFKSQDNPSSLSSTCNWSLLSSTLANDDIHWNEKICQQIWKYVAYQEKPKDTLRNESTGINTYMDVEEPSNKESSQMIIEQKNNNGAHTTINSDPTVNGTEAVVELNTVPDSLEVPATMEEANNMGKNDADAIEMDVEEMPQVDITHLSEPLPNSTATDSIAPQIIMEPSMELGEESDDEAIATYNWGASQVKARQEVNAAMKKWKEALHGPVLDGTIVRTIGTARVRPLPLHHTSNLLIPKPKKSMGISIMHASSKMPVKRKVLLSAQSLRERLGMSSRPLAGGHLAQSASCQARPRPAVHRQPRNALQFFAERCQAQVLLLKTATEQQVLDYAKRSWPLVDARVRTEMEKFAAEDARRAKLEMENTQASNNRIQQTVPSPPSYIKQENMLTTSVNFKPIAPNVGIIKRPQTTSDPIVATNTSLSDSISTTKSPTISSQNIDAITYNAVQSKVPVAEIMQEHIPVTSLDAMALAVQQLEAKAAQVSASSTTQATERVENANRTAITKNPSLDASITRGPASN